MVVKGEVTKKPKEPKKPSVESPGDQGGGKGIASEIIEGGGGSGDDGSGGGGDY